MREVCGGLSALSQTQMFLPRGIKTIRWENLKGGRLKTNERWRCHVKNHNKLSTFSSRFSTDVPLYESPGASFDQYLEDKRRVLKAMFPDGKQLNESEKRIEMPPMKFLFLSVRLVVDLKLRCKSVGEDYPFGVPHAITKLLELDITRWELQGLHRDYQPPHFALGFKGAIYPDRRGKQSRLRNQTEIQISFVASPAFALAPHHLLQSIAESVCKTMIEDMKVRENGRLLADYETFKREKKEKKMKNQN